jgi:hypothetical protein
MSAAGIPSSTSSALQAQQANRLPQHHNRQPAGGLQQRANTTPVPATTPAKGPQPPRGSIVNILA